MHKIKSTSTKAKDGTLKPTEFLHLDAVEVVHSQDGAPLVLVAEEAETFGLARLLVTHQVDVDDLAIPARVFREKCHTTFQLF